MDNQIFCICGHSKAVHKTRPEWQDVSMCIVNENSTGYHMCIFKTDNLKYLEDKYAAKHK